jgi:hypothetical protein
MKIQLFLSFCGDKFVEKSLGVWGEITTMCKLIRVIIDKKKLNFETFDKGFAQV